MLPTHVGMDRGTSVWYFPNPNAPHARGDGPSESGGFQQVGVMLPTHVGMDLVPQSKQVRFANAPHARGDGPRASAASGFPAECSPRTWGWTVSAGVVGVGGVMLPTHVGMDRHGVEVRHLVIHAPHARGDGPPCLD